MNIYITKIDQDKKVKYKNNIYYFLLQHRDEFNGIKNFLFKYVII